MWMTIHYIFKNFAAQWDEKRWDLVYSVWGGDV